MGLCCDFGWLLEAPLCAAIEQEWASSMVEVGRYDAPNPQSARAGVRR